MNVEVGKVIAIRGEQETDPEVAVVTERAEVSANRDGLSGTRGEKSDRHR